MQQDNEQLVLFHESSYGRTSEEHSLPTTDKTSTQSSIQWLTSGRLNKNGLCWTLSCSESPNDDEGYSSSLSSTLLSLNEVPTRYYLSKRAASGVLRRAERRNKKMPLVLREALKKIADQ